MGVLSSGGRGRKVAEEEEEEEKTDEEEEEKEEAEATPDIGAEGWCRGGRAWVCTCIRYPAGDVCETRGKTIRNNKYGNEGERREGETGVCEVGKRRLQMRGKEYRKEVKCKSN